LLFQQQLQNIYQANRENEIQCLALHLDSNPQNARTSDLTRVLTKILLQRCTNATIACGINLSLEHCNASHAYLVPRRRIRNPSTWQDYFWVIPSDVIPIASALSD
jgi:hypothetical protein